MKGTGAVFCMVYCNFTHVCLVACLVWHAVLILLAMLIGMCCSVLSCAVLYCTVMFVDCEVCSVMLCLWLLHIYSCYCMLAFFCAVLGALILRTKSGFFELSMLRRKQKTVALHTLHLHPYACDVAKGEKTASDFDRNEAGEISSPNCCHLRAFNEPQYLWPLSPCCGSGKMLLLHQSKPMLWLNVSCYLLYVFMYVCH